MATLCVPQMWALWNQHQLHPLWCIPIFVKYAAICHHTEPKITVTTESYQWLTNSCWSPKSLQADTTYICSQKARNVSWNMFSRSTTRHESGLNLWISHIGLRSYHWIVAQAFTRLARNSWQNVAKVIALKMKQPVSFSWVEYQWHVYGQGTSDFTWNLALGAQLSRPLHLHSLLGCIGLCCGHSRLRSLLPAPTHKYRRCWFAWIWGHRSRIIVKVLICSLAEQAREPMIE